MPITKSAIKLPSDEKIEFSHNLYNRGGLAFYNSLFISRGFPNVVEIGHRKMAGLGSTVTVQIVDNTIAVHTVNPFTKSMKTGMMSGGVIKDVAEDIVDTMLDNHALCELRGINGVFTVTTKNILPVHNAMKALAEHIAQNTQEYNIVPPRMLRKGTIMDVDGRVL